MILLIAYFLLAVGVSFLCSILEAVLLSLSPSFVSSANSSGRGWGKLLFRLKEDVDRPLAAILSLNTIAHTVGAAGVGAQAQVVFKNLPVSVISGILTLLILVLSEIIPKTIGATYWRQLAPVSTFVIYWLTLLLAPLVVLSQFVSRIFAGKHGGASVSRQEISAIADLGQEQGILDPHDAQALRSVVDFRDKRARDILTPRVVVTSIHPEQTVRELLDQRGFLTFSRYPVIDHQEKIHGFLLKADLLQAAADQDWSQSAAALARPVLIVPDSAPLKMIFQQLLHRKEHLAVVVDEYGSFCGIVSLENILETLIGQEIMDEADRVTSMRDFARHHSQTDQ